MGLFDFLKGKDKKKNLNDESVQAKIDDNLAKQFYALTVADVVHETSDAISIYFDLPPHLQSLFSYKAGQYITLRVIIGEQTYLRSYSLSSFGSTDGFFRIAVKQKQGGAVSGYLLKNCHKGQSIDVFPPLGTFSPDINKATTQYFLFAGGSGITPILSIIKALLYEKKQAKIVLLYANKNIDNIIYKNEIDNLQTQYNEQLNVWYILDNAPNNWSGLTGIFQAQNYAEWLQKNYPQRPNAEYFVCGPTPMMQEVETGMRHKIGIAEQYFHIEYFDIEKQPNDTQARHTNPGNNITTSLSTGTAAEVILGGKKYNFDIPKGQTVLSACMDQHLDAPFMCEAGVCSSCKAKLVAGKVTMTACYALSEREISEGYILTCQSLPQTDKITVNYDL